MDFKNALVALGRMDWWWPRAREETRRLVRMLLRSRKAITNWTRVAIVETNRSRRFRTYLGNGIRYLSRKQLLMTNG